VDRLELVSRAGLERELAENLSAGRLPDRFLYLDEAGAAGWLALADSSEFDIAAALEGLLRGAAAELAALLPERCDVVSLGAGSGRKERLLLEALCARGGRPCYFPVDISAPLIERALAEAEPLGLEGCGLVAPLEALPRLAPCFRSPLLLCCLGNTFCNFEPHWLLPLLRDALGPDGRLLLDFHLVSSEPEAAQAAVRGRYGSSLNRAFNLGPLLRRGLEAEACELEVALVPVPGLGWRTRKAIRVRRAAQVRCGEAVVRLAEGSTLELGFTYKYTAQGLEGLLAAGGLRAEARFASPGGEFMLLLLRPGEAR